MTPLQFQNKMQSLGGQIGCDKVTAHQYASAYGRYLSALSDKSIKILEIGIGGENYASGGQSLLLWRRLFPKAQIYGLDIYDKSHLDSENIRTFILDQADQGALLGFFEKHGDFDVIIDDGSHMRPHVLASLFVGINHVVDGGFYIIEDVMTSYWPLYGGSTVARNFLDTPISWVKHCIDIVHRQDMLTVDTELPNWRVASVGVHPGIVFLEIGDTNSNLPQERDFVKNQQTADNVMYGRYASRFRAMEFRKMENFDKLKDSIQA